MDFVIRATIIAAQSLDGCITRHDEPGTDFCSEQDQRFFHEALEEFDSMIMGRATFEGSRKAILTSQSRRWLRKIVTHRPADWTRLERKESIEFTRQTVEKILHELESRGRQACAILGGESIYEQALQRPEVEQLWITVEAQGFGQGKRLAASPIHETFQLESLERLGPQTALLRFRRPLPQRA